MRHGVNLGLAFCIGEPGTPLGHRALEAAKLWASTSPCWDGKHVNIQNYCLAQTHLSTAPNQSTHWGAVESCQWWLSLKGSGCSWRISSEWVLLKQRRRGTGPERDSKRKAEHSEGPQRGIAGCLLHTQTAVFCFPPSRSRA